ncbi:MAG: alpha/beta hydrolase, partial [Candidatus Poribacteria bacterium]|nr:alpha/beta hydrolase [Candidatus Poribacteria bacterium]
AQQDKTYVRALAEQSLTPWMRYFLTFDPRPALEKIRVPVLALNGELDVQVDAEQNLTAIAEALEKGGNRNVTVHRLPEHNHLFQRAKTGLVNEYGTIEETISPPVLNLIQEWLLLVTQ